MRNNLERAAAKEMGEKYYMTGNPCPHGHTAPRYTSTGSCVECMKHRVAKKVADGYFKTHYARNSEEILAKCKEYRKNTPAEQSRKSRNWAARNPEKWSAISKAYKARRRSAEVIGVDGRTMAAWIRGQQKRCFYCERDCESGFHVDHFLPLSKGGAHVLTNLRIACSTCNLRKSASDPLEWIDSRQAAMFREAA